MNIIENNRYTHADILHSVFCITSAALPSPFLTWPWCDDIS